MAITFLDEEKDIVATAEPQKGKSRITFLDEETPVEAPVSERSKITFLDEEPAVTARPEQPAPPVGTSLMAEIAALPQALQQGIEQPTEAIGETATALGIPALGKTLRGAVEAPKDYVPAAQRFMEPQEGEFQIAGFAPQYLPRAAVEQAPQVIGTVLSGIGGRAIGRVLGLPFGPKGVVAGQVAGQFLGPALFEMGQIVGPVARERAANQGREEPNTDDLAWAWGTAGASGALNAIGAKYLPFGDDIASGLAKSVSKALAGEFTTEGAQAVVQQAGESFLTERGLDIKPKQALGEAIIGGVAGGGAAAAAAPFTPAVKAAAAAETKVVAEQVAPVAPETAQIVSEQANQVIAQAQAEETAETPDERVARLQREAQEAAGEIELEEEGVAGLPPIEPTPPVTPTPEAAVAPLEPVVPAEGARSPVTPEVVPKAENAVVEAEQKSEQESDTVKVFRGVAEAGALPTGGAFFTDSERDASAYAQLAALRKAVEENEDFNDIVSEVMAEEGANDITDLSINTIKSIIEGNNIQVGDISEGAVLRGNIRLGNVLNLESFGSEVGSLPETWNELNELGLVPETWESLDEDVQEELSDKYRGKAFYSLLEGEVNLNDQFAKGIDTIVFTDQNTEGRGTHRTYLTKAAEQFAQEAAPAAVEQTPVAPAVTPQLEPLRRVARAEQTEEDVAGLVDAGFVEVYNGQPVITQAGLEALPEAERPRLTPEARKIQIDTRTSEAAAEAISKNLRIGVDQVPVDVRMPAGWTLVGDVYVPPQPTARITPSDIETAVVPEEAGDVFANLVRRKQEVQPAVLQKPVGSQFQNPEEFRAAFDLRGQGHTRFAIRLDLMQEDGAITEDGKNLILATIWDNNTNDEFLSNMEMGSARKNVKSYGYGGRSRQTVEGGRVEQKPLLELIRATRRGGTEADKRTALTLNTFWHEFGHAGYYSLLDAKQKKAINDAYSKTTRAGRRAFFAEGKSDIENTPWFSKYYAKNESEWFAQSFAEYVITQKSDQKKLVPVFEQLLDKIKAVFTKLFNRKEQVNLNDIFDFILRGEAYGQKPTWQGYTMSTKPAVYGTPRGQAISPEFTKRLLEREGVSPQDERRQQIIDGISLRFKRSKNEYGNNEFKTEYDFGGRSQTIDKILFSLEQFDDSTVAVDYFPIKDGKYASVRLLELEGSFKGRAAAERAIKRAIAEIEMDERVGGAEVAPTPEVREARREPAITPQQDRDYLDAVERGDLDAASRAAENTAKSRPDFAAEVYHGVGLGRLEKNRFDVSKRGTGAGGIDTDLAFFFSKKKGTADIYAGIQPREGVAEQADQVDSILTDGFFTLLNATPVGSSRQLDNFAVLYEGGTDPFAFDERFRTWSRWIDDAPQDLIDTAREVLSSPAGQDPNVKNAAEYAIAKANEVRQIGLDKPLTLKTYLFGRMKKITAGGAYDPDFFYSQIEKAWNEGYDILEIANVDDGAGFSDTIYAVRNPEQIKSADPVTYDDAGNIIPPSQRFQPEQADIRYRRRVQMGRAGMEQAAVEARLQEIGFPTGGIIRVVNEPDADFEGRTIILDGKVTGIELNASALKDNAAIDRVLNHEFAESANADGALNRLVERLTPKEKKEINDTITRLRYEERARTSEEAARAIETLAEAWKGRGFFTRAVARVEAWASKLGFKMTRRAAEYIAARNLADINAGFRTAYNRFISTKEGAEARYSYAGPQAEMPQFMRDSFAAAQDMASKGEDAVTIRMATGWILNPYDKKLRWEIPDKNIKLAITKEFRKKFYEPDGWGTGDFDVVAAVRDLAKNKSKAIRDKVEKFYKDQPYRSEKKYIPLMFFINHPQLFKAYPDLAFVEASFNPDDMADWKATQMAAFMPAKNRIIISGSNLGMALSAGAYQDLSGGMRQRLLRSVMHEIQHWIQEKEGFAVGTRPQLAGFERYKRTAGEIEARDVEARMGLTESQRKSLEPYSSENIDPADAVMMGLGKGGVAASFEIRESRREPEAIPTFTEGTPEAATLKEMATSMAKVDAASEAKGGKPETYKISEIASVWMDSGLGERELQDAITEYTNLTPANAARVARAIAKQYDTQQQIAEAVLETEAGVTVEGLPEGMEIPKDVDPKNKRTVLQRVIDATTGVRVKPVILQVPEKTALKEQIRMKARETREAKKAQQETADAVVEAIKALELRGPMRPKQAQALAKRAAKVIWTSEKSMENFIAYAERVMANTNYDADLREAKAAQKRAKELSKRDSIAAPQRFVLEAIGNIGINLLNDPREFADVVNHYLRSFKPVVSEAYVVVPDSEMESYLSMAEDEVNESKAEFDVEDNEKLAEKYGVSVNDLQRFLDAEDIMDALESYAKREAIEGILNEKSSGVKEALKGVDTTTLRADQRKLIDAMKVIDVKSLDSAEKQSYIRIGNNIIFNNNQTNGAEFFVATAKGQQSARDLAKNTAAMTKNKAWANILPSLGSRKAKKLLKSWASELQSIADTFRNAFGKEAMTVFYEAMGMVDLDLGFTQAARTLEEIQEKMAKFYDKLGKKYKGAATNQDGILSEGIVGYLIQNVPAKGEADSLAQRRGLMQQNVANLRKSGDEDKIQMADRIQQLMQRLDGNTVDQMLSNLKREYPANYESLMWLKDELFPQYKDFLKFSDENFNDQANNYNTPNYLPIIYSNASPALDLLQGKKKYYDNLSSSPKQSSYTIKRSDYTQLPMGSDGRTPKEIGLNLRKNAYNSLSDQITRAYTNPARQRIYSFLKTPEAEEALGGKANLDFFADRIERLMGSRERRGSLNEGFFGKAVDVIANLVRDIGTRIALAGSYQLIRQPADQVTVAVGATGRADLMAEHLAPRSIQNARPVLDLFSIGRRGDASSGYKYINQMEGAQSRLERYYTEGNWVKAKEAAKRFSDKFMAPLKVSDFTVAAATWMTFYRAYLAKNGIKFTTWEDAANLIKSDDAGHRRAAAHAENMTDIYQGSSDPTKMAVFAQKGKTGTENLLKSILVPFNSFGIQFRSRVSSDITEIFTRSGDWKGKAVAVKDLSATIGGTIMFGLAKRFILPAITYGGIKILYAIFGVDVEEPDEEKQKEEFDQKWRQLQGDIISTMVVGGFGQMIEGHAIDGMNYIKYMIDTANESESVLDDDGEIMSFNEYSKERAPFYRYRSFDNAPSLGMLDIGMDQAGKAVLNTKMVLTPEEMERFTPEEQRFLYVALLSDWLYLAGFNDADFARMWDKGRRDMIKARKEEEKELKRIREGR